MGDQTLRRLALRTLLGSFPGTSPPDWARRLLDDGIAGYVLFGYNVVSPDQVAKLVGQVRAGRPHVIVGIDEEGGDVTRLAHADGSGYPGNAALGAVDDPDLTRRVHHAIGSELRHLGINLNLAPVVDVNVSDDNPVIGTRSFGLDPSLVARHGAAAVTGLQQAGVAACAKHFPGHGATVADSHEELPTVPATPEDMAARELVPFAAAIAAGTRAVMTAHIRVPALTGELPATLSRRVLTDLLRDELGFTGAVLTDALEMRGASAGIGVPEAAVRALAAGADLLCIGAVVDEPLVEATAAAIVAATRDGRLPPDRLEQAAARAAELAVPPTPVAAPTAGPDGEELGLAAAHRALRWEGTPAPPDRPLLVQLDSPPTQAAGERPWGLARHLPDDWRADLVRVSPGDGTTPADLVAASAGRTIVVAGRDTHRRPEARTLVEQLAAAHPGVVLVEMGWPAAWRPAGLRGYLATYGASRANGRAAADALFRA